MLPQTPITRQACLLLAIVFGPMTTDMLTAQDARRTDKALTAKDWQPRPDVIEAFQKRRPEFEFVEANIREYALPDLLAVGKPNSEERYGDPDQWMSRGRSNLLDLFRQNVYGIRPETAYDISYETVETQENLFGIGATGSQIRTTITAGAKTHSFDFVLVVPKSDRPVPAIVHINNRYLIPLDKAASQNDPFWPVEMIVRRGYATAGFHTSHVDPDQKDGYEKGIRKLLDAPSSAPETRWKSISAWGWGASRVLDHLLTLDSIDNDRVAVAGNSRAGKTALWAAAEDSRFHVAYSNDSGCGGAALSRRAFGETVARINTTFPHWFCDQFKTYGGQEAKLPVDQHMLIGLIAPRAVYVASADEDLWADPRGEYAALVASAPVFDLFGLEHITDPIMPPLNQPRYVGKTGYHIRTGVHNLTEQDWGYFLNFVKLQFGK